MEAVKRNLYYRDSNTTDDGDWLFPSAITKIELMVKMPPNVKLSAMAAFENRPEYEHLFSGDDLKPLVEDCGETYEVEAWVVKRIYSRCNPMEFHSYGMIQHVYDYDMPLDRDVFLKYEREFNLLEK